MSGMKRWTLLLALTSCLLDLPRRCAAECDEKIENRIRAEHRDPMEFSNYDETLSGEFQIVRLSSGDGSLNNKEGTTCLKMEFSKKLKQFTLRYADIANGNLDISYNGGALVAKEKDDKGEVILSHRLVYLSPNVVAFYSCSDTDKDPWLAVVAVSSFFVQSGYTELVKLRVNQAREALEKVGVDGFAKIPIC